MIIVQILSINFLKIQFSLLIKYFPILVQSLSKYFIKVYFLIMTFLPLIHLVNVLQFKLI
jgi:succinate dehydrogenase hydrophobic anchor subunit